MRVDGKTGSNMPQMPVGVAPAGKVTIHDVHIVDSSGSMSGGKYNSAIEGVNQDIMASKETARTTPGLTSTMSIIEFSGTGSAKYHMFMKPIEEVKNFSSRNIGGMTALNETVGEAIERILAHKRPEDKVLLKIFTDGDENGSRGKYTSKKTLSDLIEKVQQDDNFTVTFVGTKNDVARVSKDLKIDLSNTLVHDNTAASVKMSFEKTVGARSMYAASAMAGEDVSKNFYSKVLNS